MLAIALVVILFLALALAIATVAWQNLPSLVAIAQVITAITALMLGARAVWGERARLQVLRPTEVFREETASHDVAALRVTVFNPSSRGNVITLAEVYRGSRPPERLVPLSTEERLVQVRDPDGQETLRTTLATLAIVDGSRVTLPQPYASSVLPVGLAPYETKVIELLVGTASARDPKNSTGLTVRVYDARRRRSSGRNFGYTYRVRWWTRLVPSTWLRSWANREDRFLD